MTKRLLAWGLVLALGVGLMQAQDKAADGDEPPGDPIDGKALLTIDNGGHLGVIGGMVFTPDGKRLITVGHDHTIQEYDAVSGERVRVIHPPHGKVGSGRIAGVALIRGRTKASEGKVLAVIAGGMSVGAENRALSNRLYLLHRDTGEIIALGTEGMGLRHTPEAIAGLPNLLRVASARGERILVHTKLSSLWRDESKEALKPALVLKAKGGERIRSLAFSPSGKRLAATTMKAGGRLFVWSIPTTGEAKLLEDRPTDNWALGLAWSPSGKQIVTGHRGKGKQAPLRLWSDTGKPEKSYTRDQLSKRLSGVSVFFVDRLAFRTENEVIHSVNWVERRLGNQLVLAFDLKNGKSRELLFLGDVATPHPGPDEGLVPLAVSPSRKLAAVAVAPHGSGIAWLDLTGKTNPRFTGDTYGIRGPVGWSKDGTTIAWRTGAKKSLSNTLNLKTLSYNSSKVNPDDFLMQIQERDGWKLTPAGETDKRYLQISRKGKPVARTPVVNRVVDIATFSAKGSKPWLAWSDRTNLYISDPATGKTLHRIRPTRTRFLGLASSPDGRYLLAASSRELLYIYRVEGNQEYLRPMLTVYSRGQDWIAWTRQGYYAATPGGERLVGWSVNNGLDKPATFHPARRFHKLLFRPDLIPLVLEKGSVASALKALPTPAETVGKRQVGEAVNLDDLLPPSVVIESVDATKLPRVKVTVKAKASNSKQPIVSLRLLLNGRPLPEKDFLLDLGEKGKAEQSHSWTVEVPDGKSELAVLARSKDSVAVSDEKAVSYKQPPVSRLFALCIGVDQYAQKKLTLKAAGNDARAVAAALKKRCGPPLFGAASAKLLLDAKATRKSVMDALAEMRTKPDGVGPIKASDLVVVFFAGHGVKVKNEFYLLPHDARAEKAEDIVPSCISGKDLGKALAAFPCQVVLLLDACHSGAAARALRPATDDATRAMTDEEVGVVVLAAAMGHEYALETKNPTGAWRGHFASAIEDAISRKPGVPFNFRDKHVYVHHLFGYVFDRVKDLSNDAQHPSLNLPSTVESFPLVPDSGAEGK